MSELSYSEFIAEARSAIKARRPWSFMRFGDGEGIILGYPSLTKPYEMSKRLDKWFGSQTMTEAQKRKFADDLRVAAVGADVLGIPGTRHASHPDKFWHRVVPLLQGAGALTEAQHRICMDVVIEMQERGGWHDLLDGLPFAGLITCRLLNTQVRDTFGIRKVETFFIPPQNRPKLGGNYSPGPHFPDRYNALPNWLVTHCTPGTVFLVGAGGLGKIYCSWIKARGGIAIDAGSIFDGWAGLQTRSYLKGHKFAL